MLNKVSKARFRASSPTGYENIKCYEGDTVTYIHSPINLTVNSGKTELLPTGYSMVLPEGCIALLYSNDTDFRIDGEPFVVDNNHNRTEEGHIIVPIKNVSQNNRQITVGAPIIRMWVLKLGGHNG